MQERIVCSIAAAQQYGLPANAILAVAEQEAGKPGQWVRNTNGTFDLGALQFNTSYVRTLSKYGIQYEDVQAKGCYPYQLAAWRIRKHVQYDRGDFWTRVANYHSYTPVHNQRYRANIIVKARRWHAWLTGTQKSRG
jgi:lysyl-tRNA synthetase class I